MARTKVTSGPKTHTLPSSAATPDAGDRIFLHGLAVECIIGFIEWERRAKQTIVIDVEMPVDCARAAASDDVADTLDYKRVAKRLIAFVSGSEFKLVETLAHRAAMLILEEFGVEWVRLSVNKPGAIRHSKDVGVAVLRTRAELEQLMNILKPGHVVYSSGPAATWSRRPTSRAPAPEIVHTWPDAQFSRAYRNVAVGFEGPEFIDLVVGFTTAQPLRR